MIVYYSDKQVAEKLNVRRVTIWRWVHTRNFPKPVKLSPRCTRWKENEIETWLSQNQ